MTIKEAIKNRISRLRISSWNSQAYFRIDLFEDSCGPWAHLFDVPIPNQVYPIDILLFDIDPCGSNGWEEFKGTVHVDDKG